ncbi:MAG: hypothetical protein UZ01_02903 [Candidatus Brocadia sinica]|nr:MAG: hypothetical protein UZ01_02903 [Candidatus Brocadia sinica]
MEGIKKWLSVFCVFIVFVGIFIFTRPARSLAVMYHMNEVIQQSETTWYAADNPHIVQGYVIFDTSVEGVVVLTIEPGCVVKFDGNAYISTGQYQVKGACLNANGDIGNPIIFTSNQAIPAPGDWRGIRFEESTGGVSMSNCIIEYATDAVLCTDNAVPFPLFQNCTIRHCGRGVLCKFDSSPVIQDCTIENTTEGIYLSNNSSPNIQHCTINNANGTGIEVLSGSSPTIQRCTISACGMGIRVGGGGPLPNISDNTISNCVTYGMEFSNALPGCTIANNVWNNNGWYPIRVTAYTASFLGGGNTGSGNGTDAISISGGLDYFGAPDAATWPKEGFDYEISGFLNIGLYSTATLTIEPGCVVKFNSPGGLIFHKGALNAHGTSDKPITFTSSAATPVPGNWSGITFGPDTYDAGTIMEHCIVEYATMGITCQDASPAIQHCTVRNNDTGGIYTSVGAAPSITFSNIQDNKYGVLSNDANPVINHCNITGNLYHGILNQGSAVAINAENNWWGDASGPSGAGPGTGDSVSGLVDYTPWLLSPFTGNSSGALSIYTFNEGMGTVAYDYSGSGNDGTISNATWTAGKDAGGLDFNGASSYVSIPLINSAEVSVSAWFYKDAEDIIRNDAIFSGFRNNADLQMREGFELRFDSSTPDTLAFVLVTQDGVGNKTMQIARRNLRNSVGSWYHAVGTYNQTTGQQRLYVNGELVRTVTHPAGNTVVPLTFYPDMRMGHSRVKNGYFNGIIDDVRLYNRPLSDQEIHDLYNAFTGVLLAHYTLDEGAETIANDSSGNGNHGAVNGGAIWTAGINGTGLGFDGVDDYVSIPRINQDEISISAWFYKDAKDTIRNDTIFSGFRSNSNLQLREGFELRFPAGAPNTLQFVLVTQEGGGARTTRTAQWNLGNSVGSWHHATGTYNKTTGEQRLYVNGALVNTQTHPAGNTVVPLTAYPDMRIGYSRVNSGYFNGVIDNVRLYKLELTGLDVMYLYNNGL